MHTLPLPNRTAPGLTVSTSAYSGQVTAVYCVPPPTPPEGKELRDIEYRVELRNPSGSLLTHARMGEFADMVQYLVEVGVDPDRYRSKLMARVTIVELGGEYTLECEWSGSTWGEWRP